MKADLNSTNHTFEKHDWWILAGVTVGALLLRLLYLHQYSSNPCFRQPGMDPLYHVEWARAFARGEAFMAGEPFFRAPLYPWFVGLCFKVFGEGLLAPRILQAIMGAAACGLTFLVGRRLFGRMSGGIAGVIAAAYWHSLYFDAELLIVPLIVVLDLLLIWLLVVADDRRGATAWFAAGLALGLSAIARPNILVMTPFVLAWIILRQRLDWHRGLVHGLLFVLACLIPIVPVTVRNLVVGHDLVLISSQGGLNFFIGNNPHSDGVTAVVPGTRPTWWGGHEDAVALAERDLGRELRPSEVSEYYFARSADFVLSEPTAWLALTARKVRLFWNSAELQNNQPIRFFAERYAPMVRLLPVGFGIVAPFGLLGLALCWRRAGRLFPLWGFVLIYSLSVISFFVCTRYKMPVVAPLAILGSEALRWLVTPRTRSDRWPWFRSRAIALVFLAVSAVAINLRPANLPDISYQGYTLLANAQLRQGEVEGAIRTLEEAVVEAPRYPSFRLRLGHALILQGLAERDRLAAEGLPDRGQAVLEDHLDRAENELRQAIAGRGMFARLARGEALHWLGIIAAERGDTRTAVRHLTASTSLDPARFAAWIALGETLHTLGKHGQSLEAYQRALELMPADHPAIATVRQKTSRGLPPAPGEQ